MHFLEASSRGFLSASVSITNQTTGPITIVLSVGYCTHCSCTPFIDPSASYEERPGKVQLTGTVVDFSGLALPNASLNLMRADLNTPERRSPGPPRDPSMTERRFQFTYLAQTTANEKGEFQFSGLEPGWYSLTVGHEGYNVQIARFWIARESVTRTTLHLIQKANAAGCAFDPVDLFSGPLELEYVRP
jgi:hypothetical protein